jgi:hypothetical protein
MCLAIGIVGVALSFGPALPGYGTLYAIVPVLRAIRATARFGYLATLAVAGLAGFGVVVLRRMTRARAWPLLAMMLLAGASAESLVAPLGLSRFEAIPPIYRHLPRDPATRVVEFPFFGPASSQFHAAYMLNSTAHWYPINPRASISTPLCCRVFQTVPRWRCCTSWASRTFSSTPRRCHQHGSS